MMESYNDLTMRARRVVEPTWRLRIMNPMNLEQLLVDKTYFTLRDIVEDSKEVFSEGKLKAYGSGRSNPPKYMKLERIDKAHSSNPK